MSAWSRGVGEKDERVRGIIVPAKSDMWPVLPVLEPGGGKSVPRPTFENLGLKTEKQPKLVEVTEQPEGPHPNFEFPSLPPLASP